MSETRTLWCLVEGDSSAFKVKPTLNADVDDLKALVYEEGKHGILRDVDAKDLGLWKVRTFFYDSDKIIIHLTRQADIDLNAHNKDSRSRLRAESDGDEELEEWKLISDYWPPGGQLPSNKLQIIVRVPATGEWKIVVPEHEQY
jgi:hypothetical protein